MAGRPVSGYCNNCGFSKHTCQCRQHPTYKSKCCPDADPKCTDAHSAQLGPPSGCPAPGESVVRHDVLTGVTWHWSQDSGQWVKAPPGPKGDSAYECAVNEGFVGTKQQWLDSLKGDQGPQGIAGPQGDRGPQGDQGVAGPQGVQGPQGEAGQQGDIGPVGPQGPAGDTGPAGPAGADGSSITDFSISPASPAAGSSVTYTISLSDGTTFSDSLTLPEAGDAGGGDNAGPVTDNGDGTITITANDGVTYTVDLGPDAGGAGDTTVLDIGTQNAGDVFVADGNGSGSWQAPATGEAYSPSCGVGEAPVGSSIQASVSTWSGTTVPGTQLSAAEVNTLVSSFGSGTTANPAQVSSGVWELTAANIAAGQDADVIIITKVACA